MIPENTRRDFESLRVFFVKKQENHPRTVQKKCTTPTPPVNIPRLRRKQGAPAAPNHNYTK